MARVIKSNFTDDNKISQTGFRFFLFSPTTQQSTLKFIEFEVDFTFLFSFLRSSFWLAQNVKAFEKNLFADHWCQKPC